jgi:hypothetical protein
VENPARGGSAPQVSAPVSPEKPANIKPLAPARYEVEFTASEELRDELKRLDALMPGHDPAEILESAVTEKLERLEAKRCGKTNEPRFTTVRPGSFLILNAVLLLD